MVFSSFTFLLMFLPVTLAIYYIMPNRSLKNLALFISSLFFYAWGEPVYVVLMIISILNDYTMSRLIHWSREQKQRDGKAFFILSIIINLGLLMFFKYYGFVVDNLNGLFNLQIVAHQLPLPIGISFYTFQTMSYTIDVYRKKTKVQKNLLTLSTYVALFPQLIAGPIVRYVDVEIELDQRKETLALFSQGIRRFIFGLVKKVLIANPMGFLADSIYNTGSSHGTLILWLAAIGFTLQIYFDFSGYSDMAIGLGKMFGFNFHENFNYPYVAKNITDFWRRWHISLSSWFRDYIYFPLGGNRLGKVKWLRNLLIVWFITGLWHGASWNYVLWGLYYFLFLVVEKTLFQNRNQDRKEGRKNIKALFFRIVSHVYVLFIVIIGWVIFRLEDFQVMGATLKGMFSFTPGVWDTALFSYQNIFYTLPWIAIGIVASFPIIPKLELWLETKPFYFKVGYDLFLFAILGASVVVLLGESFNPFIYYRF